MAQGSLRPATVSAVSPFSSGMVDITFKTVKLSMHRAFLESRPKLLALFSPPIAGPFTIPSANLIDTSIDVGHILVMWLYSGIYQPLQQAVAPSPRQALKTAFGVYSLARQHELPDLEKLAAGQISLLRTQVNVDALIDVIEEAYPRTVGKDLWMESFLAEYIRESLKKSETRTPAPEPKPDDKDISVTKLMFKGLLKACVEVMRDVAVRETALADGSRPLDVKAPTDNDVKLDWGAEVPATLEEHDGKLPQEEAEPLLIEKAKKKKLKVVKKKKGLVGEPELEPELQPEPQPVLPPGLEPAQELGADTDSVGLDAQATIGKKKKKKTTVPDPEPVPEPQPEPTVEFAPKPVSELAADTDDGGVVTSKKKKKEKMEKMAKKKKRMVPEPELDLHPEPNSELAPELALEVITPDTVTNNWKRRMTVSEEQVAEAHPEIMPAPGSEPVPEQIADTDGLLWGAVAGIGKKKKKKEEKTSKKKRRTVLESEPKLDPELNTELPPEPAPESTPTETSDWDIIAISDKKEKEKRKTVGAGVAEQETEAQPGIMPAPGLEVAPAPLGWASQEQFSAEDDSGDLIKTKKSKKTKKSVWD